MVNMDATEQNSDDYIERLFPRCSPPKTRQGQQRGNFTRGRVYQHTRRERASMSHRHNLNHPSNNNSNNNNNNNNSSDSSENETNHHRKDAVRGYSIPTSLSHHSALNNDPNDDTNSSHQNHHSSSTTSINKSEPARHGGEILLASGRYNTTVQQQRNNYTYNNNNNNNNNNKVTDRSSYNKRRYAHHKRNHPTKHNNNNNVHQYTSNNTIYNTTSSTTATSNTSNTVNSDLSSQKLHTTNSSSSPASTTAVTVIKSHSVSELDHHSSSAGLDSHSVGDSHVVSYNYDDTPSSSTLNNNLMINDNGITNDSTSATLPQDAANYAEYDVKFSNDTVVTSSTTITTIEQKNTNNSNNDNNLLNNNELSSPRDKYLHIFVYDDAKNSEEPIELAVNRHDDSNDNINSPTRESPPPFIDLSPSSSQTNEQVNDVNQMMGSVLSPIANIINPAPTATASFEAQVKLCPLPTNNQQQNHTSDRMLRVSGGSGDGSIPAILTSSSAQQQNSNKSFDHNHSSPSQISCGEATTIATNKSLSSRSIAPGYPQRIITLQKSHVTRLPLAATITSRGSDHGSLDTRFQNQINYPLVDSEESKPNVEVVEVVEAANDADHANYLGESSSPSSTSQHQLLTSNSISSRTNPVGADDNNDDNNNNRTTSNDNIYSITDLLHLSSLKDSEFDASIDELNHHDIAVNDMLSLHDNEPRHQGGDNSAISNSSFVDNRSEKLVSLTDDQVSSSNINSSYQTHIHQIDITPRYQQQQQQQQSIRQAQKVVSNKILDLHEDISGHGEHKAATPTPNTRRLPSIVEEEKQINQKSPEDTIEHLQATEPSTVDYQDNSANLIDNIEITQQQQPDPPIANPNSTNLEPSLIDQQQQQRQQQQQQQQPTDHQQNISSVGGSLITKDSLILLHERVHGYNQRTTPTGPPPTPPPSVAPSHLAEGLQTMSQTSSGSILSLRNKHLSGSGSGSVESYKGPPLLSHFHCLSDIESGPEENEANGGTTASMSGGSNLIVSNHHNTNSSGTIINSNNNNNNSIVSNNNDNNPVVSSNSASNTTAVRLVQTFLGNELSHSIHHELDHAVVDEEDDDDIHEKITTSALMFPRLDEGLSSGAESVDDEPYDDDECADDADNDDDDDDNDVDDTDLDQPSPLHHNLTNTRQDPSNMPAKLQYQQGAPIKRKIPQSLTTSNTNNNNTNINNSNNNNNNNNNNNINNNIINNDNSILDGSMNQQALRTSVNGGFNGGISSDNGLSSMMKTDSYIMPPSQTPIHRSDLGQGNEHANSSALTKQSDMKQPLNNFDQSLVAMQQSSSNNTDNTQQLNHWSSQQQPSTSQQQPSTSRQQQQQQDFRENNDYSLTKLSNPNEVKINQFSSDTDNETDRLLGTQRNDQLKTISNNHVQLADNNQQQLVGDKNKPTNTNSREVLIEGMLFMVKYLGSTQLECDGQSTKQARVNQAEMAVYEVKNSIPEGEPQPHTEMQLFISTEKIMVLDQKHKKIMMDHSLRTISYIADIGEILVLMARRRNLSNDLNDSKSRRVAKMICHVFESDDAQLIAQSMNQAFQLAYMEFLKASGIEETGFLSKEMDYQEVLNSQEMSTDELEMFANRKNQREVIVPKQKGEILGISIVESGWGSMLPTVVIANLKPEGPSYRCKKLAIGDQILSINGNSLVGLPLADCQEHIRKTKNQTVAKLSIVPCPITVEVKIRRPDTKFQLGFSVQNGVICSLLRGGIAERGGVRVGHRIMSINGTTVVGVPHEKIVTLLASSVGEIRMKTCLTSLYRLMLGQEHPVHF